MNNSDKLDILNEILIDRLEDIFDDLGIRLKESRNYYYSNCQIHCGNNPHALAIYKQGYWKCFTKNCHTVFNSSIIGFTRGVLSQLHCDWTYESKQKYGWQKTLDYLCNIAGIKWNDIGKDIKNGDNADNSLTRFLNKQRTIEANNKHTDLSWITKRLKQPQYLLDRGFNDDILSYYMVGLCENPTKDMNNRIVIPILDENGNYIGCTGRSIFPQCNKCNLYHKGDCPTNYFQFYSKWRHSSNNIGSYLFNYCNIKEQIKETGKVILVEGPLDVLFLEQNEIHDSVAIFGTNLTEQQQIQLELSGASNIYLALDDDEAGKQAIPIIKQKLERSFNIHVVPINKKMDKEELWKLLKPNK